MDIRWNTLFLRAISGVGITFRYPLSLTSIPLSWRSDRSHLYDQPCRNIPIGISRSSKMGTLKASPRVAKSSSAQPTARAKPAAGAHRASGRLNPRTPNIAHRIRHRHGGLNRRCRWTTVCDRHSSRPTSSSGLDQRTLAHGTPRLYALVISRRKHS